MCPIPPFLLTANLFPPMGSCHARGAAGRNIHELHGCFSAKISLVGFNMLLCLLHLKNSQLCSEDDEGCAVTVSAGRAMTPKERLVLNPAGTRARDADLLSDHGLSRLLLKCIKLIIPLKFRLDSEIVLTFKKLPSD